MVSHFVALKSTFDRLSHCENAPPPIEVTFSGIVTLVRAVHPANAPVPIVSFFESELIETDLSFVRLPNAALPMWLTVPDITTLVIVDAYELYHGVSVVMA